MLPAMAPTGRKLQRCHKFREESDMKCTRQCTTGATWAEAHVHTQHSAGDRSRRCLHADSIRWAVSPVISHASSYLGDGCRQHIVHEGRKECKRHYTNSNDKYQRKWKNRVQWNFSTNSQEQLEARAKPVRIMSSYMPPHMAYKVKQTASPAITG